MTVQARNMTYGSVQSVCAWGSKLMCTECQYPSAIYFVEVEQAFLVHGFVYYICVSRIRLC